MKKYSVLFIALLFAIISNAQTTLRAVIKNAKTNEPLIGATASIIGTAQGAVSDTSGTVMLNNIPDGKQTIKFSYVGYEPKLDTLNFPLLQDQPLVILLMPTGKGEGQE